MTNKVAFIKDLKKVYNGAKLLLAWAIINIISDIFTSLVIRPGSNSTQNTLNGFQILGWFVLCGAIFNLLGKEKDRQVITEQQKRILTIINWAFIVVPLVFFAIAFAIKGFMSDEKLLVIIDAAYMVVYLTMSIVAVLVIRKMVKETEIL